MIPNILLIDGQHWQEHIKQIAYASKGHKRNATPSRSMVDMVDPHERDIGIMLKGVDRNTIEVTESTQQKRLEKGIQYNENAHTSHHNLQSTGFGADYWLLLILLFYMLRVNQMLSFSKLYILYDAHTSYIILFDRSIRSSSIKMASILQENRINYLGKSVTLSTRVYKSKSI